MGGSGGLGSLKLGFGGSGRLGSLILSFESSSRLCALKLDFGGGGGVGSLKLDFGGNGGLGALKMGLGLDALQLDLRGVLWVFMENGLPGTALFDIADGDLVEPIFDITLDHLPFSRGVNART